MVLKHVRNQTDIRYETLLTFLLEPFTFFILQRSHAYYIYNIASNSMNLHKCIHKSFRYVRSRSIYVRLNFSAIAIIIKYKQYSITAARINNTDKEEHSLISIAERFKSIGE